MWLKSSFPPTIIMKKWPHQHRHHCSHTMHRTRMVREALAAVALLHNIELPNNAPSMRPRIGRSISMDRRQPKPQLITRSITVSAKWFRFRFSLDCMSANAYVSCLPSHFTGKDRSSDRPPVPKLLRIESTPASFQSTKAAISPEVAAARFVPITSTTLSSNDQPIINFDFSQCPIPPSTIMPPEIVAALAARNKAATKPEVQTSPSNSTQKTHFDI